MTVRGKQKYRESLGDFFRLRVFSLIYHLTIAQEFLCRRLNVDGIYMIADVGNWERHGSFRTGARNSDHALLANLVDLQLAFLSISPDSKTLVIYFWIAIIWAVPIWTRFLRFQFVSMRF